MAWVQLAFVLTDRDIILVDRDDAIRFADYDWRSFKSGRTTYVRARINGRRVYLHRAIMDAIDGDIVDHRNGDGLDCCRDNLRRATHGENMRNTCGRASTRRSRFKGVSRGSGRMANRWRAAIRVDGRSHHLGYFAGTDEGEISAARAYDQAAQEYFGQFARPNFPAAA